MAAPVTPPEGVASASTGAPGQATAAVTAPAAPTKPPSMIAVLLRLKLRLLGNGMTRSTWQLVGTIFALLYGLGVVGMIAVGLAVAGGQEIAVDSRATVSVLLGAGATLIWVLVPLFLTGGDSVMDPRQLIPYGIGRRQLVLALVLCGLVSISTVLTLLWQAGHLLYWRADPAAMLAALVMAPVTLGMLSLLSQAATTAASAWFSGRRARDLFAVLGVGLAVMIWPITTAVQNSFDTLAEARPVITAVLAATPLGAAAAVPADVAAGDWAAVGLRLVIVVATTAVALLVIRAGLLRITERPRPPAASRSAGRRGLGVLGLVPDRPWAAVAARALIYWMRDPRYGGSLIVLPGLVAVAVMLHLQTQADWTLYGLGLLVAFMLGFGISADVSYDHSAFSLHVTAGVRGVDDRLGRAVALLAFAVPATLVAAILPAALVGDATAVVLTTAVSLGLLLASTGISSLVSARFTYPVPRPGDSPFKQPPGAAGRTMMVQLGSMLVMAATMLPELVLWVVWTLAALDWLVPVLVAVTLLKGIGLLVLGIRLGARVYDRHQPELFQQVSD